MSNSLKLGTIFGVEVGVHWSWIFVFLLVTWSFASGVLEHFYPGWNGIQLWIGGALVSAVFFLSVLMHEMSHAIMSNRLGLPVRSITLFVFGGVANLTREPDNAGDEFKIAVVGPATSLALAAVFAGSWGLLLPFSDGLAGICANLALINAFLAVFNMLPGFPLDGGRVFRALVWSRNHNRLGATRWASRTGEWIAYILMAVGIVEAVTINIGGLWLVFIGFFLRNAAVTSYEQLVIETTLSGIIVRDVMRTDYVSVPPEMTVDELVQQGIMRQHARCFAVIAAGEFAGLITLTDVRKVARDAWPATSVYRAMTPASRLHTVAPGANLLSVLQMMSEHDVNQLPVVDRRELVGMLDRGDVIRFIQVRRDLGNLPPAEQVPQHAASTDAH